LQVSAVASLVHVATSGIEIVVHVQISIGTRPVALKIEIGRVIGPTVCVALKPFIDTAKKSGDVGPWQIACVVVGIKAEGAVSLAMPGQSTSAVCWSYPWRSEWKLGRNRQIKGDRTALARDLTLALRACGAKDRKASACEGFQELAARTFKCGVPVTHV
jgi:hypothetical protein